MALIVFFAAQPNIRAYAIAMTPRFGASIIKHGERTSIRRRGFRHFCTDHTGEHLDTLAAFAETKPDLTSAQVESLDQLMDTLKTRAAESFGAVCAELSSDNPTAPAPERLSQLQAVLDVGSTAIAQVRPSFGAFYTSLTAPQQQALDRLLSPEHQHRHGD